MSVPSKPLPTLGGDNQTEDPKIREVLQELQQILSGGVDDTNIVAPGLSEAALTDALMAKLGVTQAGLVRRGKSIIATEEARTNTAYGLLATPDRVSGIVLPTDGLICVGYQAMWKEALHGSARAAIFIGGNQLKIAAGNPITQAARCAAKGGAVNQYCNLHSGPLGLAGMACTFGVGDDATTGQVLGSVSIAASLATEHVVELGGTPYTLPNGDGVYVAGPCFIFAAAGTYDISVQFKAVPGGSVTAKNRKLWVWTMGF